jgi:cyclic pyranopterin phosphate synthase
MSADGFTHLTADGAVHMVDVSGKEPSVREATAQARVTVSETVLDSLVNGTVPKGDVWATARIAGIAAAKKCAELLPLAHTIGIHGASVDFDIQAPYVIVRATVRTADRTGVEMEALTAASIAALSIVDMVKGLDRSVRIDEVYLLEKRGGRSGTWTREI